MTDPLTIIFDDFGIWFLDQVQLSIYSSRALFHKYFVAMKYRLICIYLVWAKVHL